MKNSSIPKKITGRQKQIHYVKYCYNHTEFNHSPKLSKLQRDINSKYQVSPITLKSQVRPSEYKIKIKPCIFISHTFFFLSPVHSLFSSPSWLTAFFWVCFGHLPSTCLYRQYILLISNQTMCIIF